MERALGWLIGWTIGGTITAWRAIGLRVSWWLAPRTPSIDPAIQGWVTVRAVVGFFLVVAANLVWGADPARLAKQLSDAQITFFLIPVQVATAVVLAAVVLVVAARRGERRRMLHNVLQPVRVVGIVIAVLALFVAAMWGLGVLIRLAMTLETGWQISVMLLSTLVSLAVTFAGSATLIFGVRAISKHCFRARDGHPVMPALVSIMLSAWTPFIGITEVLTVGWDAALPRWVAVCLLVVGPALVMLLSAIEIARLVWRFEIPLRHALSWD